MNVKEAADEIITCFKSGGKVLICGNGGSAAMASHMAGEFVGKFEHDRQSLPALSLFDLASMTAIANDYGYEFVFSRPVSAFGKKEDILLCLSTSGKSKNVIYAMEVANVKGMSVISAPFDGDSPAHIQENQLKWVHDVCRIVEKSFL